MGNENRCYTVLSLLPIPYAWQPQDGLFQGPPAATQDGLLYGPHAAAQGGLPTGPPAAREYVFFRSLLS